MVPGRVCTVRLRCSEVGRSSRYSDPTRLSSRSRRSGTKGKVASGGGRGGERRADPEVEKVHPFLVPFLDSRIKRDKRTR